MGAFGDWKAGGLLGELVCDAARNILARRVQEHAAFSIKFDAEVNAVGMNAANDITPADNPFPGDADGLVITVKRACFAVCRQGEAAGAVSADIKIVKNGPFAGEIKRTAVFRFTPMWVKD